MSVKTAVVVAVNVGKAADEMNGTTAMAIAPTYLALDFILSIIFLFYVNKTTRGLTLDHLRDASILSKNETNEFKEHKKAQSE